MKKMYIFRNKNILTCHENMAFFYVQILVLTVIANMDQKSTWFVHICWFMMSHSVHSSARFVTWWDEVLLTLSKEFTTSYAHKPEYTKEELKTVPSTSIFKFALLQV